MRVPLGWKAGVLGALALLVLQGGLGVLAAAVASGELTAAPWVGPLVNVVLPLALPALLLGLWAHYALARPLARLRQEVRDGAAVTSGPALREVRELAAALRGTLSRLRGELSEAQAQAGRYATVLAQMRDAVLLADASGRVELANRAFGEMFGVNPEEARGRTLEEVTLNFDLSLLCARAQEQGATQSDELRVLHPTPRSVYAVVRALPDAAGRAAGTLTLLRDLTELSRLDQVRRDFVANASHELRSPATGIKALAEVLEAGAIRDPEKGPHFVAQIVRESDRLTRILDDMLTLTRVERGQELLAPQWVEVGEAAGEALAHVQAAAMTRGVELRRELGAADRVWADAGALQTVLVNLLDNAVKYTPGGGAVILAGRAVPTGYEFAVSDTGVGIPPEHRDRIFERFYRVDKARDRATGGTGLGLAIVKHLAEAHGGRVSVSSEPGAGSTFTLFFPAPPSIPAP